VSWLARQHLVNVGKCPAEILLGVVDGGAPVPGLDEIRPDVDDGVEQLDRKVQILAVDRGLHATHQQIGGIAGRAEPDRPDTVFDVFRAFVIGRHLERLEQPVEILGFVAALRSRQRARGLDRLEWLGQDRFRACGHHANQGEERRRRKRKESSAHAKEPNPLPRHNKDQICRGSRAGPRTAAGQAEPQPCRALKRRWTLLIT
jgi:hypothetical protein